MLVLIFIETKFQQAKKEIEELERERELGLIN